MTIRALKLPNQWQWWGLLPLVLGLLALDLVEGLFSGVLAGGPALLWVFGGMSLLLMPGNPRVTGYLALGGVLGLLFSLPVLLLSGFGEGLLFAFSSIASFMVAGKVSVQEGLTPTPVPLPEDDLRMNAKVALDEATLGFFLLIAKIPGGERAERMCSESLDLHALMEKRGWIDAPEAYHQAPKAPAEVKKRKSESHGIEFEALSFDSEFQADPEMPGASQWQSHEANRTANAWVLRHPGPARPWLLCIHGYRMGDAWVDFQVFNPRYLHQKLGFNLLMPNLPLHGSRKIGRLSGNRYLDGNLLEFVYAQTQALWDLRRWLSWLRESEDSPRIGLYGVSLGGYNTGLVSAYEHGLEFGVALIPAVDLSEILWRAIPTQHRDYFASRGLNQSLYQDLLRPVSPLSRMSLLPPDRRYVVAATADRIVPVGQPALLAEHWGVKPRFYQGSHMSFTSEYEPRAALEEAIQAVGWQAPEVNQ